MDEKAAKRRQTLEASAADKLAQTGDVGETDLVDDVIGMSAGSASCVASVGMCGSRLSLRPLSPPVPPPALPPLCTGKIKSRNADDILSSLKSGKTDARKLISLVRRQSGEEKAAGAAGTPHKAPMSARTAREMGQGRPPGKGVALLLASTWAGHDGMI